MRNLGQQMLESISFGSKQLDYATVMVMQVCSLNLKEHKCVMTLVLCVLYCWDIHFKRILSCWFKITIL